MCEVKTQLTNMNCSRDLVQWAHQFFKIISITIFGVQACDITYIKSSSVENQFQGPRLTMNLTRKIYHKYGSFRYKSKERESCLKSLDIYQTCSKSYSTKNITRLKYLLNYNIYILRQLC